jgi:DNA-binding CsgD family transcriptional regulator
VDAALRGLGIRRQRTGRARRPSVGWESLTDSELGVIRLVAEGPTNRQIGDCLFISRRTVGSHLATCSRNWTSATAPSWPPRSLAAKDSDKHSCGPPGPQLYRVWVCHSLVAMPLAARDPLVDVRATTDR